MADNEGADGREARADIALSMLLRVYFQALREEPLPGRLVETVRELAASHGARSVAPNLGRTTLQ